MEISKSDESQYRKEVKEGIQIFQKSFEGAAKTKDFPEKKQLFEKSAREALQAINDAAKALANKEILAQKDQLQKDYDHYLQQSTPDNQKQVEQDLSAFRKTLE